MSFWGDKFNLVLATSHIPLRDMASQLTPPTIENCIQVALMSRRLLPARKKILPVGVLGLNPHAGENGLIGTEERDMLCPLIRKLRNSGVEIEGPLVPDAAFLPKNLKRYSFYVALYHDQGLIPFKLLNGSRGAQVSLGLPFVRTSVDHGTAKDIFGLNKADPSSMKFAIELALKLSLRR
jgi:4-hydroxythreonine-4-phosphate dehydrogenase